MSTHAGDTKQSYEMRPIEAMPEDAIEALSAFPKKSFKKHELIIRQGDPVTKVYYLSEGTAQRVGLTSRGDELTYGNRIANGSTWCLIGAISLYNSTPIHDTSFIALTPCVCYELTIQEFRAFLYDYPAVMEGLLSMVGRSFEVLNASFRGKMSGLAPARIATYLMSQSIKDNGACVIPSKLNMSAIARDVGLHRLTVGRIINAMVDDGCIKYRGDLIEIMSIDRLSAYAQGLEKLDYREH